MPLYRVTVDIQESIEIEADNEEEALEEAKSEIPDPKGHDCYYTAEMIEDDDGGPVDDYGNTIVDTASSVNDYAHHNEEASIVKAQEDSDYPPY